VTRSSATPASSTLLPQRSARRSMTRLHTAAAMSRSGRRTRRRSPASDGRHGQR
jgi:hypothetical protein